MYWILGWQSLTFNILNMSSYWLLVVVSDEKSIINLIKGVLYVMSCFTLAAFKAPLFVLAFSLLWYVLVWISLRWSYLTFAEVLGYVDPCISFIWGVSTFILSNIFPPVFHSSLSGTPPLVCLMVYQRALSIYSFFYTLFSFCPQTWYFQFTYFQVLWFLPLSSKSKIEFFIEITVLSIPETYLFFIFSPYSLFG